MTTKAEYKWIIHESRMGPSSELVILIPRMFLDDDDYYYFRAEKAVIPQSRVFDTPQAAALAAIELNQKKIHRLENENKRFLDWYNELERQREEAEQETTTT